jgi:predicted TIM-barrel fold metal-dependent hydrolase
MLLDGHIHIFDTVVHAEEFAQRLRTAGIDGGVIISLPPASFRYISPSGTVSERLDNLFAWCNASEHLFPFYWIDPVEDDALEQVDMAVERGVMGFKVICDHYYPGDKRALAVFGKIAKRQRPILFHSGILWDGKPSSIYNRPAEFEVLLDVEGLRFALAHVSWPWWHELIAVYGKFLRASRQRPDLSVEMFIDTTPGTPPIYRQRVLQDVFTVGYEVQRNIFFGTDCQANDYDTARARGWIKRDRAIFQELGITEDVVKNIVSENVKRFVGISA